MALTALYLASHCNTMPLHLVFVLKRDVKLQPTNLYTLF